MSQARIGFEMIAFLNHYKLLVLLCEMRFRIEVYRTRRLTTILITSCKLSFHKRINLNKVNKKIINKDNYKSHVNLK
jgi:hypothetical protein